MILYIQNFFVILLLDIFQEGVYTFVWKVVTLRGMNVCSNGARKNNLNSFIDNYGARFTGFYLYPSTFSCFNGLL